ncbi:MAG: hypothetical protein O2999_07055 [Nitrospirae bacterium]|nr:hypothetical protein [Nitrospirota bacterium]
MKRARIVVHQSTLWLCMMFLPIVGHTHEVQGHAGAAMSVPGSHGIIK